MTRVFVTGGAGYIGSHTCKLLSTRGYEVQVYDNLSRGHRDFVKWGRLIEGDVNHRATLRAAIAAFRPEAILHFAAFAYVGESAANPQLYYDNNVGGIISVLSAMREVDTNKLILSSSCTVYGEPCRLPITEDMPLQPISPYGRSKLMAEQICRDFGNAHGIRTVSLRFFNAAGADPDGEIGERHVPETHLIPRILKATDGQAFELYGDDYPTPDGTCIRDFVHVLDLADAHIQAATYLFDGGESDVFNLGMGQGSSVRDVIETVQRITRRSVSYKIGGRRDGDPASLVAEVSKAKRILSWSARQSDLETIITSAWAWYLKDQSTSG
jgi:UDP-glucose-4-epimerase GalE